MYFFFIEPVRIVKIRMIHKMKKLEHWHCACCKNTLTFCNDPDEPYSTVTHLNHFDISRSNKALEVDNNEIVEDFKARNEKMLYYICEKCFLKILNESKTLGDIFYYKPKDMFLY